MIKKIVTLLISLSIALSAFPCSIQAASADSNKEEILKALNIIDEKMPSKITHNDFVNALMNIVLSGGGGTSPESFADNYGLTGSDGVYNGKEAITVAEAVKYAVIVAGYDIKSKDKTIDSYLPIGSDLDLLDGVKLSSTANLTGDAAMTILFNLLEVNPLVWNYNNSYETQTEEDMLGMYRDIYYHKGIVTANEYTAVNSTEGLREGMIQINGENFDIQVPYDENVLGKWVEVYVQESRSDDPVIIYVGTLDSKNEILEIEAKDIEAVAEDFSKIDYYVNDGNKLKTAKLANNLKVIYNGEFYGDYTTADLKPDIGKIELISNDGDKTYEIVKVTSYQTMIVEGINTTEKVITSKYNFEGCLDYVSLEDSDIVYSLIKDDEEISLFDISIGDVLSVAKTKNPNDERYKIYVSSETEESAINSIYSEEDEIITEISTYKQTAEFKKELAHKNQTLELSKIYTFYFDVFGNIVYAVKSSENDYCLIYRVYKDEGLDDAVWVKYLTLDNEWMVMKLRDKIRYNETSGVKAEAVYNSLLNEDPQIVKLKTNKKDEITSIILPKETGEYKEDVFTKTPDATYECRSSTHFDNKIFMTATTNVFVMPEPFTRNQDDYYVKNAKSFFKGDTTYTISAYDIDNFGLTELIAIRENDTLKQTNLGRGYFLVTNLSQALSADDEVCTKVEGSGSGFKDMTFLTNDDEVISKINIGGVINFTLDKYGMITAVRNVENLNLDFAEVNQTWLYTPYTTMKGTIADIDHEKGMIKLNCVGVGTSFILSSSLSCMSYDKSEQECELISTKQLQKGNTVMVRVSYCSLQELIRVVE